MLTRKEIFKTLRKELPFLRKEFRIKKIGIFGSFASGKQDKGSDIDIVLEFEKPIGLAFMDLVNHLEGLFDKKADILTPDGINSIRVDKISQSIKESVVYI